jgi:hypothetical protein
MSRWTPECAVWCVVHVWGEFELECWRKDRCRVGRLSVLCGGWCVVHVFVYFLLGACVRHLKMSC